MGKTERNLVMAEHLNPREKTAVNQHLSTCGRCQNEAGFDNFEVLRQCNDRNTVYLHETLLIRKFQPSLSVKLHNKGGSSLKVF